MSKECQDGEIVFSPFCTRTSVRGGYCMLLLGAGGAVPCRSRGRRGWPHEFAIGLFLAIEGLVLNPISFCR